MVDPLELSAAVARDPGSGRARTGHEVVWPLRVGEPGGPTPWQARSGRWRRTGWGTYVPADTLVTPRQRVVELAALWPDGVVTGWAALAWRGARWFEGMAPDGSPSPVDIHIGVGRGPRAHRDLAAATQESVPPWAFERDGGVPVALSVWAVAFAMRHAASVVDAVKVFDMAAYDDLVERDELVPCTAEAMTTRAGVPQLRAALPLVSENSWSPQEPVMRCVWHLDAHRPMPLANRPVFGLDGRHVGTPDVIDWVAGVFGQYEGAAAHLVGAQRSKDIRQDAAYRDLGLEGVTMVVDDVRDPRDFIGRLHAAYARAERRPSDERRWLSDIPPTWVSTTSVAQRRALAGSQRDPLLAYRRPAA